MYMNSAVFPIFNAYLSHICSGNKTKEFKSMFTQFKKYACIEYMDQQIGIVLKNVLVAYG